VSVDDGRRSRRSRGTGPFALLAVAALVVVAAVVAWALLRDGDDEAEPSRAEAELATVDDLRALAERADGPVFWAGPQPGMQYEVSETTDGRIYIRYLPGDVEVGDPRGNFLTVGTYPAEDAFPATRQLGQAEGAVVEELEGGGVAVYNEETPTSVYLAFPGINRQIEVFHPDPEEARRLAYDGAIQPILVEEPSPEQTGQPIAVSEEELREIAGGWAHPIYWLGPREDVIYELTRLPNGQVYVRYLPEGVDVGDPRAEYETVGTYPAEDGVAAIQENAERLGAETFEPPGGGVAYFDAGTPTNVHFAPPGASYQVEVFHPQAGRAEELVRGGDVVPID
jgi:hypothetical protein